MTITVGQKCTPSGSLATHAQSVVCGPDRQLTNHGNGMSAYHTTMW